MNSTGSTPCHSKWLGSKLKPNSSRLPIASSARRAVGDVERDLRRMHFEREPHAAFAEHVENRIPTIGELLVAFVDHRIGHRRERIQVRPDARAGETVHHADAQLLRSAGRVLHVLGRAAIDAGRIAVAPHMRRQDRLVPLVDPIAHRLAHQVRADRVALQIVAIQQVALGTAVVRIGHRLVHFEVIAPARELDALVTEVAGLAAHIFQRQIGPLASEQRDGTGHELILLSQ